MRVLHLKYRKSRATSIDLKTCYWLFKVWDGEHKYASHHTLKFSCETASELRTSASIASSSRSIRSIFSRICWRAASEHRAARSEPTWPCVSCATYMQTFHSWLYVGHETLPAAVATSSFHYSTLLILHRITICSIRCKLTATLSVSVSVCWCHLGYEAVRTQETTY